MMKDRAAFPPVPSSVSDARHFVELRLTVVGCPERSVRSASLLVSELATNAVLHASTEFSVSLRHEDDDGVIIEVADTGTGNPVVRDPGEGGGNGLRIVEAIAEDWGVREQLEGKAVFFRLPC